MANNYRKGDQDTRPWGKWEVLDGAENFCVKKITVLPSSQLSLQLHHHRSEHWVIAEGKAKVTLGDKILFLSQDDHVYIPVKTKHRIENETSSPLVFIEIQTGDNLDESDIVRFEDIYGRA